MNPLICSFSTDYYYRKNGDNIDIFRLHKHSTPNWSRICSLSFTNDLHNKDYGTKIICEAFGWASWNMGGEIWEYLSTIEWVGAYQIIEQIVPDQILWQKSNCILLHQLFEIGRIDCPDVRKITYKDIKPLIDQYKLEYKTDDLLIVGYELVEETPLDPENNTAIIYAYWV